jgi:hypothetical protein
MGMAKKGGGLILKIKSEVVERYDVTPARMR